MSTEFDQRVGDRLRERRDRLGLTREKLCEKYVDISPGFLSDVERGIKGLSAEMLCNLCEGLGLSMDAVARGKSEMTDVSSITALLSTLDEKYIPLVEELIITFIKTTVLLKEFRK